MYKCKSGFIAFLMLAFLTISVFADSPRTWDAIFDAQGQGDYVSAKIDGPIRFSKFVHYPSQTLLKVKEGPFEFALTGEIVATADEVEGGLYSNVMKQRKRYGFLVLINLKSSKKKN